MDTRVAIVSIIVENLDAVDSLNSVLHDYGDYIIGRMGVPYRVRGYNLISVALDAPTDVINSLTGTLGRIDGITAKAAFSKV